MTGTSRSVSIPKLRVRVGRYLPLLILLGLAVPIILPQVTTLEHSLQVIEGMLPWAVGLALVAQALSYLGSGYLLRTIVALVDQDRTRAFRAASGWLRPDPAHYCMVAVIGADVSESSPTRPSTSVDKAVIDISYSLLPIHFLTELK